MRFMDLFWYYGDIAFYLILFGVTYLWIYFSPIEKDVHHGHQVYHHGKNEKNDTRGAVPLHHKDVCIHPSC